MSRRNTLILTLLLTVPVLLFLIHHYTGHSKELHPTGFTADENVLYMSYAHQYLDQQAASLFYSNPFDGDPQSSKIYFQPVNLLFAPLLKAGVDPGLCFSLFGLLMAFGCIFISIKIIQHLVPGNKYVWLIALLFTWGGGLTAIAGLSSAVVSGMSLQSWTDGIYLADPANGWWGMNWGRTLFIPLEAYYHFLFFLTIYLLLKQKWKAAAIAGLFLSISHPFTGIEYLLILMGWLLLEKIVFKNKNIPTWFLLTTIATTFFHGWYYLVYLSSFPEHRQLFSQYSAGWTYSFRVFVPAYSLVVILSVLTIYFNKRKATILSSPYQRLFLCWAIIAFLLSKHEWFIRPMQPLHFTRGYIWAGLFLFGLPGLNRLLEIFAGKKRGILLITLLCMLFLLDNSLWVGNHLRTKYTSEWEGHITNDTKEIFSFLQKNTTPNDLLVGDVSLINYMANAYSPVNAWVSHPYNTPRRDERLELMKQYLGTGIKPAAWDKRRILLLLYKKNDTYTVHPTLKQTKIFENNTYILFTP